jgi:regulator of cell morphogenesis and NO signaling
MTTTTQPLERQPIGHLAVTRPGASRVFHRHGLDFCCGGAVSLEAACGKRGLDAAALAREIETEDARTNEPFERWLERPLGDVVQHVLDHFHVQLRSELPRLVAMAQKVERVHGDKETCPCGLAVVLERLNTDLELHMQKEEQVLFPMVLAGRGRMATMPVQCMEQEHEDAGRDLTELRRLTSDFTPPAEACGTWRALYLGLEQFERDLMAHMSVENNVVFPRALTGTLA